MLGHAELARLLAGRGAPLDASAAASGEPRRCADMLLLHSSDAMPAEQAARMREALRAAGVTSGEHGALAALAAAGGDAEARGAFGRTPLALAVLSLATTERG